MFIVGHAGWPAYNTFLIVLCLDRPIYDSNLLRPSLNPQKPVSGLCRVRGLVRTLTLLCITIYLCLGIHSGQIWWAGICFCHACIYFTILLVYKKGHCFCYNPHHEIWFKYLISLLGKLILVYEITLMFFFNLIYFYNLVLNTMWYL